MLILEFSPDESNGIASDCSDSDVHVQYVERLGGIVTIRSDGSANILNSKQLVHFDQGTRKVESITPSGIFLLDDGSIFELSHSLSIIHRPVAPSVKVAMVASMRTFSICVSTENALFTWGYSGTACLGLGENIYQVKAPAYSRSFEQVTAIACSETHAVAATRGGLFCWGEFEGSTVWEPSFIDKVTDIAYLAAGRNQTLWSTASDCAVVHLLGIIDGVVTLESKVVKIIAEGSSAAALLSDGSVFTWGATPYVDPLANLKIIDICLAPDSGFIYALAREEGKLIDHVKRGFRPANLPAKTQQEAAAHQIEVARVLEASRRAREDEKLAEEEDKYLSQWWDGALRGVEDVDDVTVEMRRVWAQHGLSKPAKMILWPIALGNEFRISKDVYERYKEANHQEYSLVNLDMPRTFPELEILEADSPFTLECSLLLKAYQTFAPHVGYVQGMSFVAVTLLMHMPSYSAFVCFCALMEFKVLKMLYRVKPDEMTVVFSLLDDYIDLNSPGMLKHLKTLGFRRDIFLLEWFLTLFTKCLSLDTASAVWDIVILDGQRGVFQVACGILVTLEKQILGQDFDGCMAVIQRGPKTLSKRELLAKIRVIKHPQHAVDFLSNLN